MFQLSAKNWILGRYPLEGRTFVSSGNGFSSVPFETSIFLDDLFSPDDDSCFFDDELLFGLSSPEISFLDPDLRF